MVSCRPVANATLSLVPTPSVPRDQHRLACSPCGMREQAAEAADAADHLGPQVRAHVRLDALDQLVAGVDVDARVAVGQRLGIVVVLAQA